MAIILVVIIPSARDMCVCIQEKFTPKGLSAFFLYFSIGYGSTATESILFNFGKCMPEKSRDQKHVFQSGVLIRMIK